MAGIRAASEPTFNLPAGSSSDFYLVREINDSEDVNNGKIVKKHGLWKYPFLTRRTGDSLVGTNEEITSSELRHGRTASKTKIGNASSSGSQDFEFSPETFDDQLEGVYRSKWVRWFNDGEKDLITKDYKTAPGYIHVRGDDGSYNQEATGKNVTTVPLFYTENEAGTKDDPYGLIKINTENMGAATRDLATNKLGKFIAHELHIGDEPVKYSYISRIPINDDIVRYQDFKHVEIGEMSLNVTVNAIVTGSLTMQGSNNPSYYTEKEETGKTRMADRMGQDEDVAIGSGDEFFSDSFKDGAEKFLYALKNTTSSTETDQYTALEGFLYVNGHQLQFASDLTMDLNNNLQSINAIFVKNAIANISPSLTCSGNITVYFTDGEKDSNMKKFGADDLKNLASENKDVEIVYAFQDKEDPEELYVFQVFKSTFSAPSETKSSDSPITLDLTYNSFGEMAVRVIRLAIPKIRNIEFDVVSVLGQTTKDIDVVLYPNVPLSNTTTKVAGTFTDADYVDSANTNGLYVFNNAEVSVNSEADTGATFSNAIINDDGTISATLSLSNDIAKGDDITVKLTVNGTDCEKTATIENTIEYIRMGSLYKAAKLENGELPLSVGDTLTVLTANDGNTEDEDYLIFMNNRASGAAFSSDDVTFKSSDTAVVTVSESGTVDAVSEGNAVITVTSKYDKTISMSFKVAVTA